jgi:Ca2+-binding RTX toxin-like protein
VTVDTAPAAPTLSVSAVANDVVTVIVTFGQDVPANSNVVVSTSAGVVGSAPVVGDPPARSVQFDTIALGPSGQYSLTAKIITSDSNASQSSNSVIVDIVDVTPPDAPTLTLFDAIGNVLDSNSNLGNFAARVEFGAADVGFRVALYANGVEIDFISLVDSNVLDGFVDFNIDLSQELDGPYDFTATVTDNTGNISELSGSVPYVLDTIPPEAPLALQVAPVVGLDGSVDVTVTLGNGADQGSTINVYANDAFANSYLLTQVSGAVTLLLSLADLADPTGAGVYQFYANITDEAGNTSSNSVDVFYGSSANDLVVAVGGDSTLIGNGGDDTLQGGDGNDTLVGGAGADSLVGGLGDDIFRFLSLDTGGSDIVADFHIGADKLDVTDLLATVTPAERGAYVYASAQGTGTSIYFDADGTGTGAPAEVATLVDYGYVASEWDFNADPAGTRWIYA